VAHVCAEQTLSPTR